jgi:Na+/H+-dicarboxylate symporter
MDVAISLGISNATNWRSLLILASNSAPGMPRKASLVAVLASMGCPIALSAALLALTGADDILKICRCSGWAAACQAKVLPYIEEH